MAETNRYYWIKLKQNFFDLDAIDFLQSQKNGCEYIVLYQKLCLIAANKDGRLLTEIGEMLIPYDANKIARDTKFSIDTVVVAMELFKKLNLIYQQDDGIISIPYVDEIVGSECESAQRVRKHRKERALQCNKNVTDKALQCNVEYRDKEIRDIDNKIIEKEYNNNARAHERFTPPTLEEVEAYCKETGKMIDAEAFVSYYGSQNWKKANGQKLSDWKLAVCQWYRKDKGNKQRSYNVDDLEAESMEIYK